MPRDEVAVQTLNVFGLPWPLGTDVANRCQNAAKMVVSAMPDVVALQEVWDETARHPLQVSGYQALWWDAPQGLAGRAGLMTLTRHPVVEVSLHAFADAAGFDALVSKGALRTVVSLPDGTDLALWNVHMQSGLDAGEVRRAQASELAGWIRAAGDRHRMVVGDLNCGPGDEEWQDLLREFTALGLVLRSGNLPTYDHSSNSLAAVEPPATIDHVFVDGALHEASSPARRIADQPIGGSFVSDHFGLEVRLPLRRTATQLVAPRSPR